MPPKPYPWIMIPDFPYYQVRADGTVRSWLTSSREWAQSPRILKPWYDPSRPRHNLAYPRVCLYSAARGRVVAYVHRLVAEAFLGPCPQGYEVSHLDGVRWHCHADNLRYVTHRENQQTMCHHGHGPVGERSPTARLTALTVQRIRQQLGPSWDARRGRALAQLLGVGLSTIRDAATRHTWRHVP